jgi:outer membrane immunogenic protein
MRRSGTSFAAIVISIVGLEPSVLAADFPARPEYKVPVAAAPVSQWTGCYVGGNIGVGWLRSETSNVSGANTISESSAGFAAGGQFGCDYQAGTMVFGIRNQINWADLKSSSWMSAGSFAGYTASTTSNWSDLLTARVGYAVQPNWLLYFHGGVAWRNLDQKLFDWTGTLVGRVSNTRTGWTVGIGSEYMFARKWSVFLEYKYANFGTNTANIVVPTVGLYTGSTKTNEQTISGGVNFRF